MTDLSPTYRAAYEMTLVTLAEIDAGVHGQFGSELRERLADQVAELRAMFTEAGIQLHDA